MAPRTTGTVRESAESQLPELSEDDTESDPLQRVSLRACIRGQSTGPRPCRYLVQHPWQLRGTTNGSSLLRPPSTAKASTDSRRQSAVEDVEVPYAYAHQTRLRYLYPIDQTTFDTPGSDPDSTHSRRCGHQSQGLWEPGYDQHR
ncbi:hypothetical protein M404DRAFT_1008661 [Pisolithus tinctorius Marx 270]|uniref:Uncharacterized protein n=1 Tax=Pisolithus tinctorius Marx 270 TaxID=870435 RepID=A0A0C3MYG9_PISTI|nr:hypothetical protein M404DRAFT_1008661 [Pisolithus tinctorius Marx 270]